MDRNSIDWRGYMPAITTPFNSDGSFSRDMLIKLLEWLHEQAMHGIVVAGTTGEWYALSAEERTALFMTAGQVLKGKMTLVAGCNAFTPEAVIENSEVAAAAGFDGILLCPPPYVRPSEDEIFAFYAEVNKRCPLPICVYNWPPGTNVDMSVRLLERLADLDRVVAIKNSTGDFRHFIDSFFTLKDKVRIFGIPMNEIGASLVQHHGADGLMGAGAVLGRDQPDFFNALWAGKTEEALALGAKDRRIMTEWFNPDYTSKFGTAPAVFKAALNVQGLPGGYPRKPILPLEEQHLDTIRSTLRALGKTVDA